MPGGLRKRCSSLG